MIGSRSSRWALVLSALAHLAFLVAPSGPPKPPEDRDRIVDPWVGQTFEAPEVLAMGSGASAPRTADPEGKEGVDEPEPSPMPHVIERIAAARPTPHRASAARPGPPRPGPAGPSIGAEGIAGVRDLSRAFARAVPMAASSDPLWSTLPFGAAGALELPIQLDEEGRLSVPSLDPRAPAQLRNLVARTVTLLSSGRFAIDPADTTARTEVLHLRATIEHVEGATPADEQAGAFGLGFEAPAPGHPGKAFFTLANGRHVDVEIRVKQLRR